MHQTLALRAPSFEGFWEVNDRFNTVAGWALFGGIVALGLSSLSSHYFLADKHERPETMGYAIAGAEEAAGAAAAVVEPIANRLAKADAAKGEATFAKCKACHNVEQGGANGIGPNLWAVIGDAIGQGRAGYAFSDSLKAKAGKWDFDQLDKWLTSPAAYATGTKMSFAGLADPADRANIILYLNSKGSNLPLPVPVAAAAAAPAAAGAAVMPVVAMVGDAAAPMASAPICGRSLAMLSVKAAMAMRSPTRLRRTRASGMQRHLTSGWPGRPSLPPVQKCRLPASTMPNSAPT